MPEIPNIKKHATAIIKQFFKAWEQKADARVADMRLELREEYEDRIASLESRVTDLEGS